MQFISNLVTTLVACVQRAKNEAGQTLVEYGLILALISIAAIVTMGLVGDEIISIFEDVITGLGGTVDGGGTT